MCALFEKLNQILIYDGGRLVLLAFFFTALSMFNNKSLFEIYGAFHLSRMLGFGARK